MLDIRVQFTYSKNNFNMHNISTVNKERRHEIKIFSADFNFFTTH